MKNEKKIQAPQSQKRPGMENKMKPIPETDPIQYAKEGKLVNQVALITGGDSGIGKAVALLFAKEGAAICIAYLSEVGEAKQTQQEVEKYGVTCKLIKGDLSKEKNCQNLIDKTIETFGKIDILVNNAGLHWEEKAIEELSTEQFTRTFENNVYSYIWITKFALKHMKANSCIINTASVTAYRGSWHLVDYAATKGAIVSLTRSLSANLVKKKIRVNAVAPGPIWTPLIASSFTPKAVSEFGSNTPMGRAGMPNEVAPTYLFLASRDASYITGQVIHVNGGEIING